MKSTHRWMTVLGLSALIVGLAITAGLARDSRADAGKDEPIVLQEKQEKASATRSYYGFSRCKQCHEKGIADPDTSICRGTEIAIWQAKDKHMLAYAVLGDQRAERMGKMLGWDVKNKKECLTCHSVWIEDQPGAKKEKNFSRDEGVSCVACHGPDKGQAGELGWVDRHGSQKEDFREAWRKLLRQEKQNDWDMTDLWDPVKRTQLCASCHIGNLAQGKLVTHEMYAAGHPPLPSFEVVTFSNQMPRHWQYLREKDKTVLDQVMKFHASEVDLEETHLLAIGGLVGLREYLQLLAAQTVTKDWPELANYSCYACHHELKSKSWRQEDRGYTGRPGRPPLHEWPTALVELGLFHAAANPEAATKLLAEFQGHMAALQTAVDAQPFGQRESVKQKADDLIHWLDAQVKQIQDRIDGTKNADKYSEDASAKLLSHLRLEMEKRSQPGAKVGEASKRTVPDYHSARQLAWAYEVLYLDSTSKHDPAGRKKRLEDLNNTKAWKGLEDYLGLGFPEGKTKLESSIPLGLERIGRYEPQQYFQYLDAVLKQP